MFRKWLSLIVFFAFFSTPLSAEIREEKPIEFVVVIPSYNNSAWCEGNLESVFSQTYPHWTIDYIDDCSSDDTAKKVYNYIKTKGMEKKCHLTVNSVRSGAMANHYYAIHRASPEKVIVILDGDDRLAHEKVLERLVQEYKDKNCWMTYGNLRSEPESDFRNLCQPIPDEVKKNLSFRRYNWVTSHLRTFYAGLFQKVNKKDFCYEGKFFEVACDVAMMLPMLELASKDHIRFIPDVLYVYNMMNPLNDHAVRRAFQWTMDVYIRSQPSYNALDTLF